MAMGVPKWVPMPFVLSQAICCFFLCVVYYAAQLVGIEPSGPYSVRVFLEHDMTTPRALRLFMYSKEDDLIHWRDLEEQAAIARSKGYEVALELFEGSPHVGHSMTTPSPFTPPLSIFFGSPFLGSFFLCSG